MQLLGATNMYAALFLRSENLGNVSTIKATQSTANDAARSRARISDSPGSIRHERIRSGIAGMVSTAVLFCTVQLLSIFLCFGFSAAGSLGSTIIDFASSWIQDFVIIVFGTQDKLVSCICASPVATALAACVGLLAKHSFALAVTAILILPVIISVTVPSREASTFADLFL